MPRTPDPLAPDARTDYRSLEVNRTTLGGWDLQYTYGPKAGQYFSPVVKIVAVARYVAPKHIKSKGNELLLTLEGSKGVLAKKWIVRPTVKRQIALAVGSFCVQDWPGKTVQVYFDPKVRFGRDVTGGLRARCAPGHEPMTSEPLDNPVDEERAAQIDAAVERVFDEEDA